MSPGLYDGFEGYQDPEPSERETAVREWLVVLDTNVLLSLYSFQGSTLDDFVQVFDAIGDRLFIPHQVMDEFWRNRRTVLKRNQGRHREREDIQDGFATITKTLSGWHRRVVDRAAPPPKSSLQALTTASEEILRLIDAKTVDEAVTTADTPTYEDRVLERLSPLLAGRVGSPPTADQREKLIRTGTERLNKRIPPGYMDGAKTPERAVGDYLVWKQTMDAAEDRDKGVLLITNDQKEDWWAEGGGATRLARPELVAELLKYAEQPLIMMRSHELVSMGALLGVTVQETTVNDAELSAEEAQGTTGSSRTSPARADAYLEFWERFGGVARTRGWTTSRTPSVNWWSMPAGGGGNVYGVSYAQFGCRSELYLGNPDPKINLHRLHILESRASEIQAAFGLSDVIHFEELPNKSACRLEIRLEDGRSILDRDLWDDTLEWLISTQEHLRGAIESTGGIPTSTPLES